VVVVRARQTNLAVGLALLCVAHVALALLFHSGWIFAKYPHLATLMKGGQLNAAQVSDASPAYLLLHLLASPWAVRLMQALLAGAALATIFVLVDRARGWLAAVIAVALLAFSHGWLVYGAVLEPDLALAALHVVAFAALALGSPDRLRAAALAGGSLGLACAFRPTAGVFGAAALVWLWLDRRRAAGARRPFAHAGVYALSLAGAALLPAIVLQEDLRTELAATMSGGQVFHLGHRPEDTGLRAHYPQLMKLVDAHLANRPGGSPPDQAHELYRRFAAAAEGKPLSAGEAEAYWLGRALAFAAEEPGAFARQLARKWVLTVVAPSPAADIAGVQQLAQETWTTGIPTRWIALLGLAGLILALAGGGRIERLFALCVLSYQLIYVVFYYQTRYGVVLLPAWAALAGCAVAAVWRARRDARQLVVRLAVCAAPFLLLLPRFVRDESRLEARRLLVPVHSHVPELLAAGDIDRALDRWLDEQAAFPDYVWPWSPRGFGLDADAPARALEAAGRALARYGADRGPDRYLLATLFARAGRCELALPLAERAAEDGFHATVEDADLALDPDLLAADCLLSLGRRDEAAAHVQRSLRVWPGTLAGLAHAVASGDASAARKLERLHDPASMHWALAQAFRLWGDPETALLHAQALATLLPDAAPLADLERAFCLLDLGRPAEALAAYSRSLAIGYYAHGSDRFDEPVRSLVAQKPADTAANLLALRHWARQGNAVEIEAVLKRHPELAEGRR
jgi:tetratricopeptide (TPR) repeat protein